MASSASTSAGKRTVKQDELRRLMKSEKQRLNASRKRVESPFAKYNRLGQLSCALCGVPVKSELLWPTHVLGKQHKEKVAQLKGAREPGPAPQPPPAKRPCPEPDSPADAKRARTGDSQASAPALPADFFESGSKEAPQVVPGRAPGFRLLPDYGDDDDEDEEEKPEKEEAEEERAAQAAPPALPPGFSDPAAPPAPAVFHSGSIQKAEGTDKAVQRRENTAEALPEGFFDDPEQDARVRKVDAPKDQLDKEWDEFQKAMRQVNSVSEAIVAEEDEEGRQDRQISEIDEQMECYRRVVHLWDRQDVLLREGLARREREREHQREGEPMDTDDVDEEDEDLLQDLLSQDWRVKGVFL